MNENTHDIQIFCGNKPIANVERYQANHSDWFADCWNLLIDEVYPIDVIALGDEFLSGSQDIELVVKTQGRTIIYSDCRVSAFVELEHGCYPRLWVNAFSRTEEIR